MGKFAIIFAKKIFFWQVANNYLIITKANLLSIGMWMHFRSHSLNCTNQILEKCPSICNDLELVCSEGFLLKRSIAIYLRELLSKRLPYLMPKNLFVEFWTWFQIQQVPHLVCSRAVCCSPHKDKRPCQIGCYHS